MATAIEEFLREKYTNQELYSWMQGQISSVFFQSYQMAYDIAKKAERAYRFEHGLTTSNFIKFGYWDSLRKGLLSGEQLYQDIKRLEVAHLDQNKREYELTKHISLVMLDAVALVQLKQTGECYVNLPEALFDLDYPGHYMRRIKSVSITIPCVTGPYTNVNCTLTLLKSSIRSGNTLLENQYRRRPDNDPRFTDSIGAIQSIVTSSAQNDSGLFEPNLRDERYLPFEGVGVISEWRFELPKEFKQFDYDTISDVVLHVRYTSREGGGSLKQQAVNELQIALAKSEKTPLARLFSARHEFPNEWHRFLHPASETGDQNLTLAITKERFPFLFQGKTITINKIELFIKSDKIDTFKSVPQLKDKISEWNDLLHAEIASPILIPNSWTLETGIEDLSQRLKPEDVEDIIVVCHYSVT